MILVVPGWNGSGSGHWQTIWQTDHPGFKRVEQSNWARPSREAWIERVDQAVRAARDPVFFVAHSLGCLAVALWAAAAARRETQSVAGAFLVAPPWLTECEQTPDELRRFLPMPLAGLPFPSMLVASENDPYLPLPIAIRLAASWKAQFVNVGEKGHINVASGHGRWEEGLALLSAFMAEHEAPAILVPAGTQR
jgi:uncharacterized protein